jgi:flavin reductase (DIM6/NTAB) family NADH-FMN oxidoreductase RutF
MSFKDAVSLVPTSVSVVSCMDVSNIYACTISSLVSVDISEDSPTIMFVLSKNSQIGAKIQSLRDFTINVLSEDLQGAAIKYSTTRDKEVLPSQTWAIQNNRFAALIGSRTIFCCSFNRTYSDQTADIYIATVINYHFNAKIKPLIYDSRKFGGLI